MSQEPPSRYANLRDGVAALREFLIVAAVLSILFAPNRVKNVLEDAGIRSLAGVEFDARSLAESEADVQQAHRHIKNLQQELKFALANLSEAAGTGASFDDAIKHLATAQRATIETEMNLNRSQQKTSDILQRHGMPAHPPATRSFQYDRQANAQTGGTSSR